jgi:molybdopterin-binding protein
MSLVGIEKSWAGRGVLRGVDLEVGEGRFCVVIGPTGCGKTTLLKIADLLVRPDHGRALLDGRDYARSSEGERTRARRRMAMVLQRPWMLSGSVSANARFALGIGGRRRDAAAVGGALESVGLRGFDAREASTLSGGEKQKLALARAMVTRPEILILDEPLSSLDQGIRPELRSVLRRLHSETGMSVLMATHDVSDALALASHAAVIQEGRIVQAGTVEDVFLKPAGKFVASFLGIRNVVPALFEGSSAMAGDLVISMLEPASGSGFIAIQPEAVTVSLEHLESSQRNCFPGRIASMERQAFGWLVEVDCPGTRIAASITSESVERLRLEPGRQVFVSFKASAVHAFR